MGEFLDYFKNKKNLANLLLLGILVMALPIAVQTMRQSQIIKSRAAAGDIVFTGNNLVTLPGNKLGFKLDPAGKPVVGLEISSPIESATQTAWGGLMGIVYAGHTCPTTNDYCDGTRLCHDTCDAEGNEGHTCEGENTCPGSQPPPPNATCSNGTKKVGDKWPECRGCDEGVVECVGQDLYDFKSVKNPSGNCGPQCATNECKWRGDSADKYNQCCGDFKSQQITRKKDASGNICGYDKGECNQTDPACGGTTCPTGQDKVSAAIAAQMKAGNYRVSDAIVGEDMQEYKGTGLCGYKYYVWQGNLSTGEACATYSFGKWADQNACPKGQCTVEWTISDKVPAANKTVSVNIKGVKDSGGWQNVDLLLDGSKTGVTAAGMDGGSTPLFKYNVNSGSAGKHTLSFTTNSGKATCTPVGEFTTGGVTDKCPADSALTVTPSTAKVGDEMVFFYPADGKHELNLGTDTWSEGIDAGSCKFDLGAHKYTCKAQSATDNGYWNHKWDSGKQCGSAAYKITGTTVVTTTHYRVAESPTDFSETGKYGWQEYTSTPVKTSYEFNDKTPGLKNIFVEFKGSDGKVFGRKPAQIKLLSADPTITSCSLSFEANNTTVLNLTGTDFGKDKGAVKSGDNTLTIKEWKDKSIKAVFPSAPEGEKLPVAVSNIDGQLVEGQCSAITSLALGAKVFCRTASSQDTDNVDLALTGDFPGGTKSKQKVKIDKEGNIAGLNQKMEEGKNYKLTLKAPKSVRKTVSFTAVAGGAINIPNFVLPIGDIMPVPGGDGTINSLDKGELNRQWIIAQSATGRSGDFNNDGRVNSIDWACMRHDFGASDDPEPQAPLATPIPAGIGTTAPAGIGVTVSTQNLNVGTTAAP
ncbi:IPT/TIG domain-containing protein [Candidatus Daviesbacteria bacterium]|nr:IPT/TIG domain-containing protein [Candidatus Daviesbacteria bacterium]